MADTEIAGPDPAIQHDEEHGEHEPLLGGPGGATQHDAPIVHNLILGTAIIAQAGIWILVAIIWDGIFTHQLILFSPHPLLNSVGLLFLVQALLILQPTSSSTPSQKRVGTYIHAALVDVAILCFFVAFVIIEVNKSSHPGSHFKSPHSILGIITYIFILVQAVVGVLQFFFPDVLGGEDKAKSIYKYHRMSGYLIILLAIVTIGAATWTDYNLLVLNIHHWAVIVAGVILLAGLYARVKKEKLGFGQ